jgi:hypothetical protein
MTLIFPHKSQNIFSKNENTSFSLQGQGIYKIFKGKITHSFEISLTAI